MIRGSGREKCASKAPKVSQLSRRWLRRLSALNQTRLVQWEAHEAAEVARQPIIRAVSAQHLAEPSVLIGNRRMHPALGLLP